MINTDVKKQLLQSYRDADCYIRELIADKRDMYAILSRGGATGVKSGSHGDLTGNITEKIIETERIINREIDRLFMLREAIITEIARLGDIRLQRIVHMKYIKGMTFEQIADRCGYCTRQVVRLNNLAIGEMFNDLPAVTA